MNPPPPPPHETEPALHRLCREISPMPSHNTGGCKRVQPSPHSGPVGHPDAIQAQGQVAWVRHVTYLYNSTGGKLRQRGGLLWGKLAEAGVKLQRLGTWPDAGRCRPWGRLLGTSGPPQASATHPQCFSLCFHQASSEGVASPCHLQAQRLLAHKSRPHQGLCIDSVMI